MAFLPVPLGREPLHGVVGSCDGEGIAHECEGRQAGAAWCRRLV